MIARVIGVENGSKECWDVCFLPYIWRCCMPIQETSIQPEFRIWYDVNHLSPRRSTTYACTPPGILTSTRTSTRENALKQLLDKFSCDHDVDRCIVIPVTTVPYFPCSRFWKPSNVVLNGICEWIYVCGQRCGRRGIDTRHKVVWPQLQEVSVCDSVLE